MLLALAGTALSAPAAAAPLVLAGDYIKIGVNDIGTLGSGGSVSPGILYDGTGTGTFNSAYDYLTPGSPFEGWTIFGNSGSPFTATNNNASMGAEAITGTLTDYSGVAYNGTTFDNRAVWTGTLAGILTVTHDYHFNDGGQQLSITTTITALTDLTGLQFARFTDPDAVAAGGDSSVTNNFQGATGVPTTDLVYAEALVSKYVIGLYSADPKTHNTAVTGWDEDTASYLAGGTVGNGDNTIGLGFDLGALANGALFTFNYAYIFGTDIEAAVAANGGGGTPPPTPAPSEIVSGQPHTVESLLSGTVKPVFSGGTLTIGSSGTAPTDFTVKSEGGVIDTQNHTLELSGVLSGPGVLEKTGPGVLKLTGVNTHKGFMVSGGVLEFSSEGSLGAPDGVLTLSNDAILRPTTTLNLSREIQINAGQNGVFDTASNDITLSGGVMGGGTLTKIGTGVLTLSGANTQSVLNIEQGVVAAESAESLGAAGGMITLHTDTTLQLNKDMVLHKPINFAGASATINTGPGNVVLAASVSGSQCLIKAGPGKLTLNAAGSNAIGACVEEGELTFNNAFAGQVWVENGGRLSGGGLILGDVQVSGVLAPGNSPGRLVVAGAVTQGSTANLLVDIDGPTPGVGRGHYDTLVLTGPAGVFTAGGAITPITRGITGDATNTYTPAIGDAFEVVTAEGGVTGAFSSIVQPTSGMPANSRFDVIYMPRSVILAVTPASYAALAGTGNGAAVGAAVDALRSPLGVQGATPAGQFVMGFAGLDAARSAQVLDQAAGAVHAVGLDTALQSHRAARGSVAGRLETAALGDRQVWADVGGARRELDGDAFSGGYEVDDLTVAVGADREFGDKLRLGVAASYAESDASAASGAARSFSHQAHLYGAWRSGPDYVHGVISAGRETYKTTRQVAFSTGPQAFWGKADGASVSADVEAGRDLQLGGAKVTLAAGLSGERLERDALTEAGGSAALSLGEQSRESLQARVGARVSGEWNRGGISLRPRASLFVLQELGDEAAETDASLFGQSFRARAASPGETAVRLGASVEAKLAERMRVDLGYRYQWSERSDDHALRATAAFSW